MFQEVATSAVSGVVNGLSSFSQNMTAQGVINMAKGLLFFIDLKIILCVDVRLVKETTCTFLSELHNVIHNLVEVLPGLK